MAWHCERWAALPEAGGLLDQPAGLLTQMTAAVNVYNAFKTLARGNNIMQLAKEQPHILKIVTQVEKLEDIHNG